MDLTDGAPYWLLLHGLAAVAPPLETDCDCDVAVVGSGITGALVTKTLRDEGHEVVILDRRDLAQGSTMASTALLQYDLDVPLHVLERRIGAERAVRAFTIGIEAIDMLERIGEEIASPVARIPSLYFLRAPAEQEALKAEFESRRRAGLDVRWLEDAALRSRWGIEGVAAIESAAAAQIDPYAFTHALLARAASEGTRIYDRTEVVSVESDRRGVTLETARGHTVRAGYVVWATGYESASQIPSGKVELASTFAVITEPVARTPDRRCILWEYAEPYLYARWVGDRLLVGGEDVRFRGASRRDRLIKPSAKKLLEKARALLPGIDLEPAFAWAGTFATTSDGLGYIGAQAARPRELFALGFGGNGITFSAVASRLLAAQIAGRPDPDADLFRFDR